MDAFFVGILLVILAGACEGLFSQGITRTPGWKWENIWGLGSLIALVLAPWPVAYLTVPHLSEVFAQVSDKILLLTFLFGIGWGLGGIFWGKAIAAVGMALGVSLLMGFINVFGPIGPMVVKEPEKLTEPGGLTLLLAVAVMIVGIVFIARAGKLRERELAGDASDDQAKNATPFAVGLLFCILSGLLSACVNFSLHFGDDIATSAKNLGASDVSANNAMWALVFTGNYLVNFIYALILMIKNKTTKLIFTHGKPMYWFWALFMGITWPIGITLMGIASGKLGDFGKYAAFPMMLLCAVLAGNLSGALTGEWKGTGKRSRMVMVLGVLILLSAFVILAISAKLG
ncbi:MAG: hypothetical protein JW709_05365 [Sedimentisphaerales bacterium]|nr:hypothetical protein [Sedimentisphaerales bacterium]